MKTMKLLYLAPVGLFDDWAHTVQIMKMCEAFSQNGVEVELVVPSRKTSFSEKNPNNADPFNYNNVEKVFKITKIPSLDLFYGNPSKFFYWLRLFSFLFFAKFYLIFKKYDILYTRETYARLFFRKIFLEKHSLPEDMSFFTKFIFKHVSGLIVLTSYIKKRAMDLGVPEKIIFVSHDGVKLEDFLNSPTIDISREKLGLPKDACIFGYIGTLKTMGMEKGVLDAILSLEFLPDNYFLYIVGGTVEDVNFYKNVVNSKNLQNRVIFAGKVSQKSIPLHISACDILVAPFPKNEHYEYFMSPLKIFEYMASKRPMIVSDLASLREVLVDGETAMFIEPNNPGKLSGVILKLYNDPVLANRIALNAYSDMERNYTWKKRASNILNFIKQ